MGALVIAGRGGPTLGMEVCGEIKCSGPRQASARTYRSFLTTPMPIIPAYRNEIVNTRDDATLLGKVEWSLSPGRNTRDYTYDVKIYRAYLKDGYQVDWSNKEGKLIFPTGDEHAKGIKLPVAIEQGLARIIELGGDVSSDSGLHDSAAERQPQPREGGVEG
jgi:hypothetical protein